MNLRELKRIYKAYPTIQVEVIISHLEKLEAETLEKAKKAWQDAQSGCTPCQGASAAYMDILGPNDPTEQLKEVKISLSPKKY